MTSPEWNRFDLCEAWYLFACDWHEGQGRRLRASGLAGLPAVPDALQGAV